MPAIDCEPNRLGAPSHSARPGGRGLDTTTPAGKAMFQMMGVFAEFERAMIAERVRAGMARARENGTKTGNAIGRPRIDAKLEAKIREGNTLPEPMMIAR